MIPPAFGLAGVNRHTWTGWGSASYSNAYRGQLRYARRGRLFRLAAEEWDPIPDRRARISTMSVTNQCLITSKLAALQSYQLAIPAPEPPAGSFNPQAAERGKQALSGAGDALPVMSRRFRSGKPPAPSPGPVTQAEQVSRAGQGTSERGAHKTTRSPRPVLTGATVHTGRVNTTRPSPCY